MVVDVYLNRNFMDFACQSVTVDLHRMHKIVGPTVEPIPKADELELAYSFTLEDQVSDKSASIQIWHTLNINHPTDYKRRSVSSGDVVVFDKSRAYVYGFFGLTRIDWVDASSLV